MGGLCVGAIVWSCMIVGGDENIVRMLMKNTKNDCESWRYAGVSNSRYDCEHFAEY